jgi:hypothetical protein
LLSDPDPQVRLAAILALADMPADTKASSIVLQAIKNDSLLQDRWLADALTSAAAAHAGPFLTYALKEKWTGAASSRAVTIIERVAEHYARSGSAKSLGTLVTALPSAPLPVAAAVIAGLDRGWPKDKPAALDATAEQVLVNVFPKLPPRAQGQLVDLAARMQTRALDKYAGEISASFLATLRNEKMSDQQRSAAAAQLIDLRRSDVAAVRQVLELVSPRASPELAQGLVDAVGHSDAPSTGSVLTEALPALTPSARKQAFQVLLSRADWTAALLAAAAEGKVSLAELSLDQKQALIAHPRRTIAARARRLLASGIPNADRQKVIDELLPLTKRTGNAIAGKLVFKNNCAKCHTHSGEGAKVGPDLTGMAVHPKEHLLIEIIDPSRSVEGNYRQYVVTTKAGKVLSGLLSSETRTTVELLDAEAKLHKILREDIDEFQASTKSLMPDGFEKQLSRDDLANLLEFLTQRGKYLPLPLDKVATAVSTRGMFYSEDAPVERLVFSDWSPKIFNSVPFSLVDPRGDRVPNVLLFYGPEGKIPPRMPKSVTLQCNAPAKAIHMLGGISGWGFPYHPRGSVSLIMRLHYEDGKSEDHPLKNGVEFADYIRRVDVPGSQFAFNVRGRQVRYLSIQPERKARIKELEFIKGPDDTAPVIVAVTIESPE